MLALESNHIRVFHSQDLTLLLEAHAPRSSTRLLLKILSRFSFHGSSTLQLVGCCCWIPAAPSWNAHFVRLMCRVPPMLLLVCTILLCNLHCALCWCVGQHCGGAGGRLVGRLCTPRWAASTRCTHHSALPQAASPLSVGCCESESALLAPLTHHSDHHIIRSVRKWDFGFGIKLLRIRVHQIGFLLPAEILSGDCQSDLGVIEGILVTGFNCFLVTIVAHPSPEEDLCDLWWPDKCCQALRATFGRRWQTSSLTWLPRRWRPWSSAKCFNWKITTYSARS